MKSFFRFLLRALVLLVVGMVSALTAMRFAIHGREVAVPNLLDKTPVEARRIAEVDGLEFEVEREYYSANVPEGKILSQLPPAGTMVRRGWEVRVAQSLGPQRVQIPDVRGQSERAAEMNIERRGLEISAVDHVASSAAPADQVMAQSPPPNASDVAAPKISLLVADQAPPQAYVMPSFVGQSLATAKLILEASGLRLGNVTQAGAAPVALGSVSPAPASPPPFTPAPNSTIASQSPAAGEKIAAGSAIDFAVP